MSFEFELHQKLLLTHPKYPKQLFEVTVVDQRVGDNGVEYKVNFKKWSQSRYDEWMPAGSLLPVNEETLQMKRQLDFFNTVAGKKQLAEQKRQQELEAQARAEEERLAKRQNREEVKNVTLSAAQQSKLALQAKRDSDAAVQAVMQKLSKDSMVCIPVAVQKQMLHDANLVKFETQLVTIPKSKKHTVSALLLGWLSHLNDEFETTKHQTNSSIRPPEESIIRDLIQLFNRLLPLSLLYRNERVQCLDLGNVSYADVYGMEHLIRFISKLPEHADSNSHRILGLLSSLFEYCAHVMTTQSDCIHYERATKAYLSRFDTASKYVAVHTQEKAST